MISLAWLRVELSFSRWTWTRGDGTASLEVEEQVECQLFGVTLDFDQGNKNQHAPLEEAIELRSGEERIEFPENMPNIRRTIHPWDNSIGHVGF